MRPTLPSGFRRILFGFGVFLTAEAGCHHADPPVAPAPPLPAQPDIVLKTMDDECAGLTAAIGAWSTCKNLEDDERAWLHNLIDAAEASFAAGKKGNPDEANQRAIALACHRAAVSIGYATERCNAGPRPRVE